ncbi:hypothetical protein T492DRAFT_898126 [Pavlovales sp. CCMP2436]|nr:hypothetical protein T492DRAFT_898126 [Pavlovales sp. CCMP2436]
MFCWSERCVANCLLRALVGCAGLGATARADGSFCFICYISIFGKLIGPRLPIPPPPPPPEATIRMMMTCAASAPRRRTEQRTRRQMPLPHL